MKSRNAPAYLVPFDEALGHSLSVIRSDQLVAVIAEVIVDEGKARMTNKGFSRCDQGAI